MASLYLIRHGQASFMQENYDKLSPLGIEQSKVLGKYLQAQSYNFDACWTGLLERHKGTYEASKEFFTGLPDAVAHEGLNEHQAAEIHYKHLPKFLEEEPELKEMMESKGHKDPLVRKGLLKLFFKGTKLWINGDIHVEGYEKFVDFKARVAKVYEYLLENMEGKKNAIAFTSGGTIGMLMGLMLDLRDEKVFEINWQVQNTSITEFSYSHGKFYLKGFNHIPHLQDEKLITYV